MGEKNWSLKLYPKGKSTSKDDLSVTLHLADLESLLPGEMIFVRLQVQILDPRGSSHLKGWRKSWVMNSNKRRGLEDTTSLAKLRESYLDFEEALTIEIECEVFNTIKNHPFG